MRCAERTRNCVKIKNYGGLGDRHQQNGVNYTLDLNTGLTQVLSDGTNTYLYGNGRISQHATQTEYFLSDALGSVRQLADSAGAVTLTQSYAPYGETVSSVGTSQTSYAFTGEIHDANGLTYLRARYMDSGTGRFISRDTWNGDYNRPLSLNRWGYVEGNPVNLVDPSGKFPEHCYDMPTRILYEDCARKYHGVNRPMEYRGEVPYRDENGNVIDKPGCRYGAYPIPYNGIGYIEGFNHFEFVFTNGVEIAYDFTTMTSAVFDYSGIAIGDATIGIGASQYAGIVGFWPFPGFNSQNDIFKDYDGPFMSLSSAFALEIGAGVSVGATGFISPSLNPIGGVAWYVGWSGALDPLLGVDLAFSWVNYDGRDITEREYFYTDKAGYKRVNRGMLGQDILSGQRSPWGLDVVGHAQLSRLYIQSKINKWTDIYEDLHNAGK